MIAQYSITTNKNKVNILVYIVITFAEIKTEYILKNRYICTYACLYILLSY